MRASITRWSAALSALILVIAGSVLAMPAASASAVSTLQTNENYVPT